jgi:hypothetical protein
MSSATARYKEVSIYFCITQNESGHFFRKQLKQQNAFTVSPKSCQRCCVQYETWLPQGPVSICGSPVASNKTDQDARASRLPKLKSY